MQRFIKFEEFVIEPDAFSECSHLMLFVYPDSSAKDFAEERDLLYSEI